MKIELALKLIIILMTLKIASPLGVFFVTFSLPIAISLFVLFFSQGKFLARRIVISGVLPVVLLLLSWLLLFTNGKYSIELYAHYFYVTSVISIFILSCLINSLNDYFYSSKFWLGLTKNLIVFHCGILIAQLVLYHSIGVKIDFGELTGGNEIRAMYSFNGVDVFRASGIFEEPSIFSAYMFSFIVIRYLFNDNSIDRYILLGTTCMLMTWSAMAIILVSLFYVISSIRFNFISVFITSIMLIVIGYFSSDFILLRYENTMSGLDPSNLTKMTVITEFINNKDLFLYGYGLIRKNMFYGLDGLGDTTVYSSLITIFGFIIGGLLTLLLLVGLLFSKLSIKEKILLAAVFIKFAWPGYVFFWFLFSYSVNMAWYSKNEKNSNL